MPAACSAYKVCGMTPPRTRFLRRGDRIELIRLQSFGPTPRPHPGDVGIVQAIDGDGRFASSGIRGFMRTSTPAPATDSNSWPADTPLYRWD
jgi:hypothetical protein